MESDETHQNYDFGGSIYDKDDDDDYADDEPGTRYLGLNCLHNILAPHITMSRASEMWDTMTLLGR